MRETCICEWPIARRSATASCPRRSAAAGRGARARRGRAARRRARSGPRPARSPRPRCPPTPPGPPRRRPRAPAGRSSESGRRLWLASSTSSTSVCSISSRSAISADRGRALQLLGQLGDRFVDFGHQVVEAARHAHGPDPVAEVAFQLAEDGRRGKGGEGDAALGVEAVDRVEQAEVGDLEEVVEGLAGAAVAQRQPLGEGQVATHQLLADRRVASLRRTGATARLLRPSARRPRAGAGSLSSLCRFAAIRLTLDGT